MILIIIEIINLLNKFLDYVQWELCRCRNKNYTKKNQDLSISMFHHCLQDILIFHFLQHKNIKCF